MPREGSEALRRDAFVPEPAARWLSLRLDAANADLAGEWLARLVDLPASSAAEGSASAAVAERMPELLSDIAEHLRRPDSDPLGANGDVMARAAALGELRFAQRASIHQLLRDYQVLADIVEEFLLGEAQRAEPPLDAESAFRGMRRVISAVRVLQQQTIDAFLSKYTATIERQNAQLLSFGRVVAHEMRQPLAVLQLMSTVLPIRAGDVETTHLIEVLDRNVRYLASVAARLERLAHASQLETDVSPREHTVNLTALVDGVVKRLSDAAAARGVRCVVDASLPLIAVDPARTELVFLNLIANGMKYSDPAKSSRVVEIRPIPDAPVPTVIVRDNGIGIPLARAKHLFRELSRRHPHRDQGLNTGGLGLGLSIVRECMDACGGTINLDSVEGEGTTVTLTWRKQI